MFHFRTLNLRLIQTKLVVSTPWFCDIHHPRNLQQRFPLMAAAAGMKSAWHAEQTSLSYSSIRYISRINHHFNLRTRKIFACRFKHSTTPHCSPSLSVYCSAVFILLCRNIFYMNLVCSSVCEHSRQYTSVAHSFNFIVSA
jgi:hypothetical protein